MGFEGGYANRDQLLAELPQPADVIAYDISDDDVLWTVELDENVPTIVARIMKRLHGLWAFQKIRVSSYDAPIARFSCPIEFLQLAPDPGGEGTVWRMALQMEERVDDDHDPFVLPPDGLPPSLSS